MSTLRENTPREEGCLSGGGEMGALMRAVDWSGTPLGPVASWPSSLCSVLSLSLNSNFPIAIYWGRDLLLLYNDAWAPIPGAKHPWALGRPAREVWSEIWDIIGPLFDQVLATGEATRRQDQLLPMRRHGYTEECYFDYTFSPIRGEDGGVAGIFNAVVETTARVVGERRLGTLRKLGAKAAQARTAEEAAGLAMGILAENAADVPFALLYLVKPGEGDAELLGAAGLVPGRVGAPDLIGIREIRDGALDWPLRDVFLADQAAVVPDIRSRFGDLPGGPWPEPPHQAVILPLRDPGRDRTLGFLIGGVSPYHDLDDDYRSFFDLVASHTETAMANARAHEEETRRAEALAELDRAKTAFFSNVSHEFRTPLTLILGPIEEALGRASDPEQRGQLELVHRNAIRLQKLVNTLLDFSRIEAGRLRASFEPTDLASLTADLAGAFRSAVERAGMRLVVECEPLREAVYVDRDMWEKVVLNLLSNAFKFTLEGEIGVSLVEDERAARLRVWDTGEGIPREQLPHIFERFHRIEGTPARSHEGTGIGLAFVRELVGLHGGTVEVESEQGEGTAFVVSIPLGTAHLPADRIGTERPAESAGLAAAHYLDEATRWLPEDIRGRGGDRHSADRVDLGHCEDGGRPGDRPRPRILLADDNADLREYLARLLGDRHDIVPVADGEAALESIREQLPDLVLTDVMMPRRDGFGLLKELRSAPSTRTLPVILLSARAGEEARVEGLLAGADDYITKPFNAREIVARVSSQLELARIRKEANEANERAAGILESITDGFLALDREWKFTYVNTAAERIIGMCRESLIGRSHWEVFPQTVGTALELEYRRAAADQVSIEFENLYEPWDRWFQMNVYPSPDGGLSIYFRDVTGRKWSEQLLAEHAAMLERIAAGRPLDECLTEVTAALSRLRRGTRACVLLADAGRKVFSAAFSASLPDSFGLVLEGAPINDQRIGTCGEAVFRGEPVGCTDIARDASWSEPWREHCLAHGILACHSEPVLGSDGQPLGSVLLCFDEPRAPTQSELRLAAFGSSVAAIAIERERAAAAVVASEARLRRIVEGARDYAIVELDPEGRIAFWNGGAERLTGWAEAEILGKPSDILFPPEDRERGVPAVEMEQAGSNDSAGCERWYVRADGSRFWGGGLVMPLAKGGATGEVVGYVKVIQDRTAWRRMEESLRDQAERLREADRRKDEFLAMLAHELRNPLSAIHGAVQLAQMPGMAGQLPQTLEIIGRQTGNLARLIDDLMDVSRITQGKVRLNRQHVDIIGIIDRAAQAIRPLIAHKRHVLRFEHDAGALRVDADPTRLEQVVGNLLTNAAKYSEPNGRITVSASREAGEAVIRVADTGVGIAPDMLPRVFDLFTQADRSLARSEGGLGIGLSLVKRLAEMHGGSVAVTSVPGRGSEFTVRLPLAEPKGQEAEPEPAPNSAGGGRRVLIVDDNVDVAYLTGRLLRAHGFKTEVSHDGGAAIEVAKVFRPDVVLLDIGLPGLDGYEVARRLRREQKLSETLIIAVSGYAQEEDRRRSFEAGMDEHLPKPLDLSRLAELIESRSRR